MESVRRSQRRKQQQRLLVLLTDGLSEEELGRVLEGALLVMDAPAMNRVLKLLGPDTGATHKNILGAAQGDRTAVQPEKRVGAAKILQEWWRNPKA